MNRYIKAMEIGLANEKKGISYFELSKQVQEELGLKFSEESERTFLAWFIENFSDSEIKLTLRDIGDYRYYQLYQKVQKYDGAVKSSAENIENKLKLKFWLDGHAAKQYLDYLELTEARKQAKSTSWFSIISIGIAVIAILIGVLNKNEIPLPPKPPYDVKIIEDNPKVKELQNENDQLKEKLYKAEMMVKVLGASRKSPK